MSPQISQAQFAHRRAICMAKMPENSLLILAAAPETVRSNDTHFLYRQDSDFWYLTGIDEPEVILVLAPGRKMGETLLFCRPENLDRVQWDGPTLTAEQACGVYGADQAFSIDEFSMRLMELMSGRSAVLCPLTGRTDVLKMIQVVIRDLKCRARRGELAPHTLIDSDMILHSMRLVKDAQEVACLRHAIDVSVQAHQRMMAVCCAGISEGALEAELMHALLLGACRAPAYGSIIAGGDRACILHYVKNNQKLNAGELVLVDAGGEYQGYAADLTRTYPVSGRFTPDQAAVYQLVLKVQEMVIAAIRPGVTLPQLQEMAVRGLTEGLIVLGILSGDLEACIQDQAYRPYYMHGIGHWLGLDVHDQCPYQDQEGLIALAPGMVLTIEPGLYLAQSQALDARWWGIGVRIEDDILVTDDGCEVLSAALPKSIEALEALIGQS